MDGEFQGSGSGCDGETTAFGRSRRRGGRRDLSERPVRPGVRPGGKSGGAVATRGRPAVVPELSTVTSSPGLVLRDVPFDGPPALALIAELQQEYVVRYGGPDETPVDPREFAPPGGAFLIAEADAELVGCAGLRRHDPVVVELKRMYVRAAHR